MVDLTEFLIKSITIKPESVSVKQFDDEEDIVTIQVLVDKDDMGRVIGRHGNIAQAIRTVVQASSYMNNEKRVKINIDSF